MEKKSSHKTSTLSNKNSPVSTATSVNGATSASTAGGPSASATATQASTTTAATTATTATTTTAGTSANQHQNHSSSHSHHHHHHHTSSHHHHSSSQHHSSNITNNSTTTNNKDNSNNITNSTTSVAKHRTHAGSHHHNKDKEKDKDVVDVKSYATAAIEQLTALSAKTVLTRNKNEEAIQDLRQRIPDIENIFDVHSRIGNGTFSTVLLGTLKKDRELPENMRRKFAIKHHIPTSHPDRIIKELKCMVEIGGYDNVVGINCTIRHNESVAFIMPYMPHDRFHDFFNKMDLSEVQTYMKNLLIALRRVHKFNVIHRDVKPSNFLYNRRKRQFLLVDFGLAQQVPTPQTTSMAALQAATNNALDGKRAREQDDGSSSQTVRPDVSQSNSATIEVSGSAKRLRCTGPQGDQHIPASQSSTAPSARVTTSCGVVNGSPFKMPLKQLNEISTPTTKSSVVGTSTTSANSGIYSTPLSRHVKSAIVGASMTNRLQQKLRCQNSSSTRPRSPSATTNSANSCSTNTATNSAIALQTPQTHEVSQQNSKYNTNRNLSATSGAKCFCYGNPQVCNICLIKKEIHASRAGTPGYRPPEVLLKYPDQTTAVDIWAAGVIFLSILSSVYPFFKAPNDYVALAEMVTIFGDKTIRKTAFVLDRLVTLSQKTKPLDLRKLCVRFRNRSKFSSPELLKKYQRPDGTCEVCKNCDQFYFNCLCAETHYATEPLGADDPFPTSAYDLLYKLLEVNPHKRITAEEALEHPFFKEQSSESGAPPKKSSKE